MPLWAEGQPLDVGENDQGEPLDFYWARHYHTVESISRHWRVHLDWWTPQELWRDYWEVVTDTGLLCIIYHNLIDNAWALERIHS